MKYTIDSISKRMTIESPGRNSQELDLCSPDGLEVLTRLWVAVGWAARDSYQFTWAGQPIIQLPHDVLRYQELLWKVRPDVIVETGVAHGGSLMLAASMCKVIGRGRVIGVDVELRPTNRAAIERHILSDWIALVEGNSTDQNVVRQVRNQILAGESVLVLLDSNHSMEHVAAELEAYAPLVTPGSYIVATDGIMRELVGFPGAKDDWGWNNPYEAARQFASLHSEFLVEDPEPLFDESRGGSRATYWPGAFLKRLPN
jgi:cephalosporin hydroxylase